MKVCTTFHYFVCSIILWNTLTFSAYGQSYGLGFFRHDIVQDNRTGLDLNPNKPFCFKNNFDVSFDLSFLPYRPTFFGYILRIIENDNRNIDLVYDCQDATFKLIIGEKVSNITFKTEKKDLFSEWNKFKIRFDLENDQLLLYTGKRTLIEKNLHLSKNSCYKFFFGVNNYKEFQTTDVPPMKIRDIRIFNEDKVACFWPLNEKGGVIAHELIAKNNGLVTYPHWITALHYNWAIAEDITVHGAAAAVAYNEKEQIVYFISNDSLYEYSISNGAIKNQRSTLGALNRGNQLLYNPKDKRLYEVYIDQQFVSCFDFQTQKWDKSTKTGIATNFWQANKFFSTVDNSIYILGGYGNLNYKNTVQQYNINTGKWQNLKVHGDFFTPRYMAALGTSSKGDTAYIIGGYGNSTGQQILNPKNLYDLLRFTVKDHSFKKIAELSGNYNEGFALANSLIIDEKAKRYYGLIFPQHKYNSGLQLITGSLTGKTYQTIGDTIPYSFHDTRSFADLYYSSNSKKFVAVTLQYLETILPESKFILYSAPHMPMVPHYR